MKVRSHPALSAVFALVLVANWGEAQDSLFPAAPLPRAQNALPAWEEPVVAPETRPQRLESRPSWTSGDGLHDLPEAPPAVTDFGPVIPPVRESADLYAGVAAIAAPQRYSGRFLADSRAFSVGTDFYSPPEFEGGLIVFGRNVALKIGGYVKADFIYDFDPIDSTDSFVTTDIPVGAPPRTNARFHARQTRLSFDTRWTSEQRTVRIFVEGDFFSDGDRYRLRHAYGEVGSLLVGKTWTTFTDVAAAPATLDFEGSVSSVNRRQAQARWTHPILDDDLTLSLAVEDTQFIIEAPVGVVGDPRSPSPDFVVRIRLSKEWGQFQIANLHRIGGFQPTGGDVITGHAWGFNFTGAVLVTPCTKAYYQIVFGEGIGSYRGLPDSAPTSATAGEVLGLFGWMVGITHNWSDGLSSNFTYAENSLDNTAFQDPDDVHRTTYLAANLIWRPLERVKLGIEYLYGLRENIDREVGSANRLQVAFIFDLP